MNRVIVQVPMSKELKEKAETAAHTQGFSSLQETIRFFLTKFSRGEVSAELYHEPAVRLSSKAEKRYAKISKDIREGKNITTTDNLDKLFQKLNP